MSRFPRITHVIYDLDGLLLDSERFYTEVTQIIVGRYGKVFDWSLKSRMIGKKAADSARILTETLGLPITPEQYLEERIPLLEKLFPLADPMPGARRLTRHLRAQGIPQGVATSSERKTFELKTCRHQEWLNDFQCIVLGDDPEVHHGKPAPDIFLVTARRLGASPEHCLVFEDAPSGVKAALAAGMSVIAVPDARLDSALCAGADEILRRLTDFDPSRWGLPPLPEVEPGE